MERLSDQRLTIVDQDLWLGTASGVVVLDLNEVDRLAPVHHNYNLEGFNCFTRILTGLTVKCMWMLIPDYRRDLVLEYQDNYLRFQFVGMDHANPEGVSYQWMLEGFDPEWNPQHTCEWLTTLTFRQEITFFV